MQHDNNNRFCDIKPKQNLERLFGAFSWASSREEPAFEILRRLQTSSPYSSLLQMAFALLRATVHSFSYFSSDSHSYLSFKVAMNLRYLRQHACKKHYVTSVTVWGAGCFFVKKGADVSSRNFVGAGSLLTDVHCSLLALAGRIVFVINDHLLLGN